MTEAAYVELPILAWLCGEPEPGTPAGGLGWTYRDEAAMAVFDRPLEDPLVEKLLVSAILRINTEVKTEAQAKLAVAALRKTMSHPDKLTANRETLDLLRDGARVVLNPGADAKTVHFHRLRSKPSGSQRLYGDQSIPRSGCETVPRGYGAVGQWHSARRC
jgi:type I restriction enzyme R subunit